MFLVGDFIYCEYTGKLIEILIKKNIGDYMVEKKYQIFISSTYTDLIHERDTTIKTILSLEHIPIGMEMFNAGDEEQWELIKRTIDTSDYYIVIIGFRYGSIANNGLSYTENEYDYAVSKNIPVLAFIKDETVPSTSEQREQLPELIEKHNNFKNKIKSRIAKFWKNKDELAAQISTSLQSEMRRKPMIGWIRSDIDPFSINKELMELSRENRELRTQLLTFESRKPDLRFYLKNKNDFTFYESKELTEDNPLSQYKTSFKTQEQYDNYNEKYKQYKLFEKNINIANIQVKNNGNIKSNNIIIDIEFPSELSVYSVSELKRILNSYENSLNRVIQTTNIPDIEKHQLMLKRFFDIPRTIYEYSDFKRVEINNIHNKNRIILHIDSLLHTRSCESSNFAIITTKKGEFIIKGSIICEELTNAIENEFRIIVK